jgi:hypothetical protein
VRRGSGVGSSALAGEAEVDDAGAAVVVDEDVVGLEVAVDEAGAVGGGEAVAGGEEHVEDSARARGWRRARRAGWAAMNSMAMKRLAVDGADVVDAGDVGVGEAGHGLGLAAQAGGPERSSAWPCRSLRATRRSSSGS